MSGDWKDMLAQLKGGLPEGEESPSVEEVSERQDNNSRPIKKEKLSIAMEKKGRGGKTATIIYGFEGDDDEIKEVATRLKQRLGIGGSSRGGEILLQGDLREKVKPLLKEMGYKV